MANNYWLGTKDGEGQEDTILITSADTNSSYEVTINNVTVSAIGAANVAGTAVNLQAALSSSINPYFTSILWTVDTATVTGTSVSTGMPFILSVAVVGGTGAVTHTAEVIAPTGPNHWDEPANWSLGVVPVASDDVIIENSDVSIRWGLDAFVLLSSLVIKKSFTGKIGLKPNQVATTADGESTDLTQEEYRVTYLEIGADICNIGENFTEVAQDGSGLIRINFGAVETKITVFDTANSSNELNKPAVQILGVNANNQLFVRECPGSVGVAVGTPFEVSTFSSVEIGDEVSAGGVNIGAGVTLNIFTMKSGSNHIEVAATLGTLTIDGGTCTTEGDYAITLVNVADGGLYNSNHINSGGAAIVSLFLLNEGTVNTLGSSEARTFTTVHFNVGATLSADKGILTITTFEEPTGQYTLTTEV